MHRIFLQTPVYLPGHCFYATLKNKGLTHKVKYLEMKFISSQLNLAYNIFLISLFNNIVVRVYLDSVLDVEKVASLVYTYYSIKNTYYSL